MQSSYDLYAYPRLGMAVDRRHTVLVGYHYSYKPHFQRHPKFCSLLGPVLVHRGYQGRPSLRSYHKTQCRWYGGWYHSVHLSMLSHIAGFLFSIVLILAGKRSGRLTRHSTIILTVHPIHSIMRYWRSCIIAHATSLGNLRRAFNQRLWRMSLLRHLIFLVHRPWWRSCFVTSKSRQYPINRDRLRTYCWICLMRLCLFSGVDVFSLAPVL